MLDFTDKTFRLTQTSLDGVASQITPLLIDGEQLFMAFKGPRDYVAFTSKRVIAVDIQGMSGKKKDFTSLPYSKVQAFSVESAGAFDRDCELELWFSSIGKIRFEFKGNTDVAYLNKLVATYVL